MEASIFSGVVNGAKRARGCAVASDEELGEIPLDPSAEYAGQRLFQITKQRVCGGAVDVHFLKHREAHAVVNVTGLLDFIRTAGFLLTKLVARETKHYQPLSRVLFVERFQASVLRCEATMAGRIHHQNHLASIVRH